jgi:hypothetical protein
VLAPIQTTNFFQDVWSLLVAGQCTTHYCSLNDVLYILSAGDWYLCYAILRCLLVNMYVCMYVCMYSSILPIFVIVDVYVLLGFKVQFWCIYCIFLWTKVMKLLDILVTNLFRAACLCSTM